MLFLATYLVTQIDGDDKNFGSNRGKFWFNQRNDKSIKLVHSLDFTVLQFEFFLAQSGPEIMSK